jgi:hypothetical protein
MFNIRQVAHIALHGISSRPNAVAQNSHVHFSSRTRMRFPFVWNSDGSNYRNLPTDCGPSVARGRHAYTTDLLVDTLQVLRHLDDPVRHLSTVEIGQDGVVPAEFP